MITVQPMKNRIGEQFVNKQGCSFIIVDYINNDNVIVEFQDEYKARVKTKYCHCKDGGIRNPFAKSVYNVGMIGNVERGYKTKFKKEYVVWNGMLQRCYSEKYQEKYPSYKGCTVCERWHRFDLFLEDIQSIPNYDLFINNTKKNGVHLDKDTFQQDVEHKIYAPDTVMFITNEDNVKEVFSRKVVHHG